MSDQKCMSDKVQVIKNESKVRDSTEQKISNKSDLTWSEREIGAKIRGEPITREKWEHANKTVIRNN